MSKAICHDMWNAPDRATAVEVARAVFGDDGSLLMTALGADLCAADMAFIEQAATDPAQEISMRAQFANGVQGYVDDRRADGPGWVSFDITAVECPVVALPRQRGGHRRPGQRGAHNRTHPAGHVAHRGRPRASQRDRDDRRATHGTRGRHPLNRRATSQAVRLDRLDCPRTSIP